jgi:hypothetical protein
MKPTLPAVLALLLGALVVWLLLAWLVDARALRITARITALALHETDMAAPQLLALLTPVNLQGRVPAFPNAMRSQLASNFRPSHMSFDVRTR